MVDREAGRVVAREHLGPKGRKRLGVGHATGEGVKRLRKVQTRLLGEGKALGEAHHGAGERRLVGELGKLALAGRAEAHDLRAHAGKHVAHAGERLGVGAAEDGERACRRTLGATRDGSVEGMLAGELGDLGDVARKLRGGRGHVDEVGAGRADLENAVVAQVEVLDVDGGAHHGDDDVGIAHGSGDVGGKLGPTGDKGGTLLRSTVEYAQLMASVDEVARHSGPHRAATDESYRAL